MARGELGRHFTLGGQMARVRNVDRNISGEKVQPDRGLSTGGEDVMCSTWTSTSAERRRGKAPSWTSTSAVGFRCLRQVGKAVGRHN